MSRGQLKPSMRLSESPPSSHLSVPTQSKEVVARSQLLPLRECLLACASVHMCPCGGISSCTDLDPLRSRPSESKAQAGRRSPGAVSA